MSTIASLSVKVFPDTKPFAQALGRYLERIERQTVVKLKAVLDRTHLFRDANAAATEIERGLQLSLKAEINRASLTDDVARLQSGSLGTLKFKAKLDLGTLRTDIQRISRMGGTVKLVAEVVVNHLSLARDASRIERSIRGVFGNVKVPIKIDVDEAQLRAQLQATINSIAARRSVVQLPVDINQADLRRQLRYLQRWVLANFKLHIPVVLNPGQVIRDLLAIQAAADGAGKNKRTFGSLLSALGSVAGTALKATAVVTGLGVAVGGLAGAVPTVVALAAAVAQLSGLVIALPAVILTGAAAFGALKVGLTGVGDALSNLDDAEAFNKALEKLSPNAREFAVAIREVAPAYREMRTVVQDRLFANLRDEIGPLATAVLPALQGILVGVAGSLGTAATYTSRWIRSAEGLSVLRDISNGVQHTMMLLGQSIQPVVEGFLRIGRVGAKQLPDVARLLSGLGDRFRDFVVNAEKSGSLDAFLKGALDTVSQFGLVLGNVGGIIQDVFAGAAAASSGGLLNNWITLTGELKQFTSSDFGQQAISDLFASMTRIGTALSPLLPILIGGIAELAKILATLAVAAAPGLETALSGLAQGINALAPAAGPVGKAIGDILTAAAPLLPVLGQLAGSVLTALATNLSTLATAIAPVVKVIAGGLSGALKEMAPLWLAVARAVAPFVVAVGGSLATALAKIMPSLLELTRVFVTSLLPELPRLTDAFLKLVPPIAEAASIFGAELATALVDLVPLIPPLAVALVDMAVAWVEAFVAIAPILPILAKLTPLLAGGLVAGIGLLVIGLNTATVHFEKVSGAIQFLKDRLTNVEDAFGVIGSFFTDTLPGWFSSAGETISGFPAQVGEWLSGVGQTIVTALSGVVEWITSPFRSAFESAQTVTDGGVNGVLRFIGALPGKALAALVDFGSSLAVPIINGWFAVQSLTGRGIEAVISFVSQLPGRVVTALSSLGSRLGQTITTAWTVASGAVGRGVSTAVSFTQQLPGRASGAISSLGSRLSSTISSAWTTATGAISRGIDTAITTIRGLPDKARSALGNMGSILYGAGKALVQGFIDGINSLIGSVRDAAGNIAGAVQDNLKGNSPTKEGPLSGRGWTLYSGQKIVDALAEGMNQRAGQVRAAARSVAGVVSTNLVGTGQVTPAAGGGNTYDITLNAAPSVPTERQLFALMRSAEQLAALDVALA